MPRPTFTPFDEHKAIKIYQRNLPHWRQEGATYFITFRLADALPKSVTNQWEDEKSLWLAARGITYSKAAIDWQADFETKLSKKEQFQFHKEFNRKLNRHLDSGFGACHFRADPALTTLRDKLIDDDETHYHLGDFIIMPNHVHLLLNLIEGIDLEKAMQNIKGGSAYLVNRCLNRKGRLWQREYYDHLVRDEPELRALRSYIRDNPSKAGIQVPDKAHYEAEWLSS